MYKANKRHLQPPLISNVHELSEKHQKRLEQSWAGVFYQNVFCRLKEEPFAVLYAGSPSRPNIAVNVLVGLETLKSGFGWSDEELYDHFVFDCQVRYALGYHNLNEGDFDLRTLYNFRQRLSQYNQNVGINLLAQAFRDITDEQIVALKVNASQQRMDSTQVASNIMDMSRLQLLVEAIQRLYRILSPEEREVFSDEFAPYVKGDSGHFVYRIKGKEDTHRKIEQVGESMFRLLNRLKARYQDQPVFQVFQRFFSDNFRVVDDQVQAKANEEISAGCLQSCDDLEATFRRKAEKEYKGYVANLSETCHPDNSMQLITSIQVAPNNREDADLLLEALPELKEHTNLETLHTDGAYSGTEVDTALQKNQVVQIPTGIKGRRPDADRFALGDYHFQCDSQDQPQQMTCPAGQTGTIRLGNKKGALVADFDPMPCLTCPFHLSGQCRAKPGKRDLRYHLDFTLHETQVARRRRAMNIQHQAGHNPRAAIEATMRTIKHPFPAGKLPVRGIFRMSCMLIGSALMCNMRSILRAKQAQQKQNKPHGEQRSSACLSLFARISNALFGFSRLVNWRLSYFSC
jgi:hypothetical protein